MSKSVLLVEDDDLFAMLLTVELQGRGFNVERVVNGAKGLAYLEERVPDAIVTDLFMSAMDGLKFIETIRSRGIEVPIIVVTGSNTSEVNAKLKDLNIQHTFHKPFTADMLNNMMDVLQQL